MTPNPLLLAYCRALSRSVIREGQYDRAVVPVRAYSPGIARLPPTSDAKQYPLPGGRQLQPAILRLPMLLQDVERHMDFLAKSVLRPGEEVAFGLNVVIQRWTGHVTLRSLQAFDGVAGLRDIAAPPGWVAVPTENSYHFYAMDHGAKPLPEAWKDKSWLAFSRAGLPYLRVTQNTKT